MRVAPRRCPREGCDAIRYTTLSVEYHLLDDHDLGPSPVARQVVEA